MTETKARLLAEFIASSDIETHEIATGAITHSKLADTLDLSSKTVTLPDLSQNLTITGAGETLTLGESTYNNELLISRTVTNPSTVKLGAFPLTGQLRWDASYGMAFSDVTSGGNTEVMRIRNNRIGIGTNNPSYTLEVHTDQVGGFLLNSTHANGSYLRLRDPGTSQNVWFGVQDNDTKFYQNDSTLSMIIKSDGDVGIGDAVPLNRLHVNSGNSSDIMRLGNSNGDFVLGYTTNRASIDLASTAGIRIRHGSLVSTYIASSGNVGIGTVTPQQPLHVHGRIQVGDSNWSSDAEIFQETDVGRWSIFGDDYEDGWGLYKYGTNAGRAIFVNANRHVGIGVNVPSYRLHVNNDVGGDVLYVSSSDTSNVTSNRLVHFRDNYSTTSNDGYVSAAWTSSPGQDVYIGKRTTAAAGYMAIKNSSGSEVFTINMANGKVGIGLDPVPTARPWSKLWVEAPGVSLDEISFEDNTSVSHFTLAGSNAHVRLHMGTMDETPYGAWIQASYDNSPDNTGTGNNGVEPLLLNPQGGKVHAGTTPAAETGEKLTVEGPLGLGSGRRSGSESMNRRVLNWYTTDRLSNASGSQYHIKTNLWGGGSANGNSQYIMGGFEIRGYRYATPSNCFAMAQFHNWNGALYNNSVANMGDWTPSILVYISTDGYVVLRLGVDNSYCNYQIDTIQHDLYPARHWEVTAAGYSAY